MKYWAFLPIGLAAAGAVALGVFAFTYGSDLPELAIPEWLQMPLAFGSLGGIAVAFVLIGIVSRKGYQRKDTRRHEMQDGNVTWSFRWGAHDDDDWWDD